MFLGTALKWTVDRCDLSCILPLSPPRRAIHPAAYCYRFTPCKLATLITASYEIGYCSWTGGFPEFVYLQPSSRWHWSVMFRAVVFPLRNLKFVPANQFCSLFWVLVYLGQASDEDTDLRMLETTVLRRVLGPKGAGNGKGFYFIWRLLNGTVSSLYHCFLFGGPQGVPKGSASWAEPVLSFFMSCRCSSRLFCIRIFYIYSGVK
jgi:hypothetical protein